MEKDVVEIHTHTHTKRAISNDCYTAEDSSSNNNFGEV